MAEDLSPIESRELFVFTLSEVVLPTLDIYTDFALSIKLVTISTDSSILAKIGYAMFGIIILTTAFHVIHWFKVERSFKSRILTTPLLICQLWPQYRALRVIWLNYRHDYTNAKNEKKNIERSISYIGNKKYKLYKNFDL